MAPCCPHGGGSGWGVTARLWSYRRVPSFTSSAPSSGIQSIVSRGRGGGEIRGGDGGWQGCDPLLRFKAKIKVINECLQDHGILITWLISISVEDTAGLLCHEEEKARGFLLPRCFLAPRRSCFKVINRSSGCSSNVQLPSAYVSIAARCQKPRWTNPHTCSQREKTRPPPVWPNPYVRLPQRLQLHPARRCDKTRLRYPSKNTSRVQLVSICNLL